MIDTPQSFATSGFQNGHHIRYENVMEVGQGGPCVGDLLIDGVVISAKLKFGGPYIGVGGCILVPILRKKFLGSCFSLAKIDLSTRQMVDLGLKEDLIFVDRIEGETLIYFTTFNKSSSEMRCEIGNVA